MFNISQFLWVRNADTTYDLINLVSKSARLGFYHCQTPPDCWQHLRLCGSGIYGILLLQIQQGKQTDTNIHKEILAR